jgi:glutamyl-tRNA synthetase
MSIITRFAPSPTGHLHVGNIRTAFINWLYAKKNKGKFILRIDDTDKERSKPEYVDSIKRDLEWLGLEWDAIYFQSERMDLYEEAKKKMIDSGRLYPCYESQEELEIKKKVLLSRNLPPIYDRSALKLNAEAKEKFKAEGVNPHYRFFMSDKEITWEDGIRGHIHFDPKKISDPVLIRADGTMTYMIASVVDDIDLKITNIIRGEDHITNTAVHAQMFEALGAHQTPSFAHLALIKSKEGEISKRLGGFDIKTLREEGIHPLAILSFFAKLGSSDAIEFRSDIQNLVDEFNLSKFGRAIVNYDLVELERINTKLTHDLSYEQAVKFLGSSKFDEKFWERVKHNIDKIKEVEVWWRICNEVMTPINTDLEFTKLAAQLLPQGEWNEGTWNEWINKVKSESKKAGKELFMPIRLALTAMENGPELKILLPLLGYQKAFSRLTGKEA